SMEPFRAFVGDMLPSEQRTKGFALQSFFIGTGDVVASALPFILTNWFGVSNTAPAGEIPASVKWSFYLGAVAFIGAVVWTVVKSKEYPPEEFERYARDETDHSWDEAAGNQEERAGSGRKVKFGSSLTIVGLIFTWIIHNGDYAKELYIFG